MLTPLAPSLSRLAAPVARLFDVREPDSRPAPVLLLVALMAVAALVRVWGLGSFGLHRPDEDTTVLAAVHILQDGVPRFPSGMIYARALVHSYLIAASVWLFGETPLALRLPSVLGGVLLIPPLWFVGRRFLARPWNVALAVTAVFLPGLIADSQEARMYIFLVTSLAAFAALVFRWERRGDTASLVAAVAMLMVAIQFHSLSIFGAFLLFQPGLLRADGRRLLAGGIAFAITAVFYVFFDRWVQGFYPHTATGYAEAMSQTGVAPPLFGSGFSLSVLAAAAVLALLLAVALTGRIRATPKRAVLLLMFLVALAAQAALFYHVAGLLLLVAGVWLARSGDEAPPRKVVALLVALIVAIAIAHAVLLHGQAVSLRKMIGMLIGRPSVWQYANLAAYSYVAAAVLLAGLAGCVLRSARGHAMPDYALFFVLAVWLPLIALGLFGWYFPPRYTEFALVPMLVTTFAVCQQFVAAVGAPAAPVAAVAVLAIVNPVAAWRSIDPGGQFTDHRAVAQYVRGLPRAPNDLVLAEEVLMQTYYLGKVDYWLVSANIAAAYLERVDGQLVDIYTHTPVIGTGPELQALLDRPDRGAIYIVGSSENDEDDRLLMRGEGIQRLLHSAAFHAVYLAPDGRTRVWKADPPAPRKAD